MKKSGLFCIFVCLFLNTSCKNFLAGKDTLEQINNSIKYANAPTVTLNIRSDYGSVSNAGDNTLKVGDTLPLLYTEGNSGYQFIKWEVTPQNAVSFSVNNNKLSTQFTNEAEIKILKKVSKISIKPLLYIRPVFDSSKTEPVYNKKGVPKNSSIYLTCSQKLSEQNDVSKISIKDEDNQELYANKNAIDNYFLPATISDNNIIISPNPNKFLDINGVEKITITIPADFYYETSDGEKISFGTPYSYTYIVNSETVDKAEVNIGKDTGDILPNGLHNYSIGETFDIEYIISEGYYFNNWSVTTGNGYKGIEIFDSNSTITGIIQLVKYDSFGNEDKKAEKIDLFRFTDPVEDDANYLKKENKIKRTFTVLTNYSGILIKPNCIQLPDINDYEPKYSTSSENFDTPITITFNKKINTNLLDYDFINIKYGNTDCNSYFIKSFSIKDDVTVLSLKPTSSIKELFKNSNSVVDLTVTIDNKKITDTEGKSNTVNLSWQYRIKYEPEQEAPVIDIDNSSAYKIINNSKYELTKKDFENWEFSEDNYGDFSINHINDKIYLDLTYSDNRTGIINILVNETYLLNTEGLSSNNEICKNKIIKTCIYETNTIQNEIIEYQLNSDKDGLIKLEFFIQDSSDNFSNTICYYVIKDTVINFSNSKIYNNSFESKLDYTIDDLIDSINNINLEISDLWFKYDTQIFETKNNDLKQLEISYGTDIDNLTIYNYESNTNSIVIKLDDISEESNTIIQIYIEDEFDKSAIFSAQIPRERKILGIEKHVDASDASHYDVHPIIKDFEFYSEDHFLLYYTSNERNIVKSFYTQNTLEIETSNSDIYYIYYVNYFSSNNIKLYSISNCFEFDSNEEYSPSSENQDLFKNLKFNISKNKNLELSNCDTILFTIDSQEEIDKDKEYFLVLSDNYDRTFFLNKSYNLYYQLNPYVYKFTPMCFYNKKIYKSNETIDLEIEGTVSTTSTINYSTGISVPQTISPIKIDNNLFFHISNIESTNDLQQDSNGLTTFEYWILPITEDTNFLYLTENEIELSANKNQIKINQEDIQNGFNIPASSLSPGRYLIATRFFDIEGNYHFGKELVFDYKDYLTSFTLNNSNTNNSYELEIPYDFSEENKFGVFANCNYFDSENNIWVIQDQKYDTTNHRTLKFIFNGLKNNTFIFFNACILDDTDNWTYINIEKRPPIYYFYTPQIIYTGTNTCTIKKLDYLFENLLITNSDNAYLTMLITSPNNYGTENPTDWLKYGALVDTQQSSGIDYYKIPEDKIYNNEYYVIYCVYADGSVKITEPKFKE